VNQVNSYEQYWHDVVAFNPDAAEVAKELSLEAEDIPLFVKAVEAKVFEMRGYVADDNTLIFRNQAISELVAALS
jgi:hypothetical protein